MNEQDPDQDNSESKTVSFRDPPAPTSPVADSRPILSTSPSSRNNVHQGRSSNMVLTTNQCGEHLDLATGAQTTRCQSVRIVDPNENNAAAKNRPWYFSGLRSKTIHQDVSSAPLSSGDIGDAVTGSSKRDSEDPDSSRFVANHQTQYRIISKPRDDSNDPWVLWKNSLHQQQDGFYVSWLSKYLHWTFRTSFINVCLVSFVFFFLLITIFALFVFWIDRHQPECIVGVDRSELGKEFVSFTDAWHLSWTTLSTVGYGIIAPGLPSTTTNQSRCTGINMLMAFESFVGVLFGGITGAIVIAKIGRIQSIAPILFCDPIVVRYGSGCMDPSHKDDEENNNDAFNSRASMNMNSLVTTDPNAEIPCPRLEFRLINKMWAQRGGEIMDASVNLVVSRLETVDEMDHRLARSVTKKKKRPGKKGQRKSKSKSSTAASVSSQETGTRSVTPVDPLKAPPAPPAGQKKVSLAERARATSASSGTVIQKLNHSIVASVVAAANRSMQHSPSKEGKEQVPYNRAKVELEESKAAAAEEMEKNIMEAVQNEVSLQISKVADVANLPQPISTAVDEGNGDAIPRRIFETLEVETDSHPFFKRTWNVSHICDEHSPLLSLRVRRMIENNNGFWPAELNNCDAIRKAVNFHEIIVSFSGTANVNGSAVYTQKVYQYVDMAVGYTFANVLSKDKDGKLMVDVHLLNDVKEQWGGGAEPILKKDAPRFDGYVRNDIAGSTPGEIESLISTVAGEQNHEDGTTHSSEKGDGEDLV